MFHLQSLLKYLYITLKQQNIQCINLINATLSIQAVLLNIPSYTGSPKQNCPCPVKQIACEGIHSIPSTLTLTCTSEPETLSCLSMTANFKGECQLCSTIWNIKGKKAKFTLKQTMKGHRLSRSIVLLFL